MNEVRTEWETGNAAAVIQMLYWYVLVRRELSVNEKLLIYWFIYAPNPEVHKHHCKMKPPDWPL